MTSSASLIFRQHTHSLPVACGSLFFFLRKKPSKLFAVVSSPFTQDWSSLDPSHPFHLCLFASEPTLLHGLSIALEAGRLPPIKICLAGCVFRDVFDDPYNSSVSLWNISETHASPYPNSRWTIYVHCLSHSQSIPRGLRWKSRWFEADVGHWWVFVTL